MKTLINTILLLLFVSCRPESKETNVLKNDCPESFDTLKYAMAPNYPDSSAISFIDLRTCKTHIKNDSLIIEIGTRYIPDSITYNNSKISRGFPEYALEVAFRNRTDTCVNNLVFCVHYDNFDKPQKNKRASFNSFLKDCKLTAHIEKNCTPPFKFNKNKIEQEFDDSLLTVTTKKNSVLFKIAKKDVCHLLADYIGNEFNVESCYNDTKETGKNNYITTGVITDTLMNHYFIYCRSRRTF